MFTKLRYAILVVLLKIVEINSQFSYPTFNGALQGDIIDLNYLTTGMIINVTLNWSGNSSPNITLAQQGLFMSSTTCSYSPYYFTLTVS
jgi:hypothetical protein